MTKSINQRIDARQLDNVSIDLVSSEIVRALTETGEDAPDAKFRFHLRIGRRRHKKKAADMSGSSSAMTKM
ncbi:hypothetical protein [Ruegeria hyattellae]|uniref:hypothetical protein n=1 Tax=Ruegeria hyattellae TaxID=3233337 RepID=UPI00355C4666